MSMAGTRNSSVGAKGDARAIFDAWQSSEYAREAYGTPRRILCPGCSQPIRWWNRRVWVVTGERCFHLRFWESQLLLEGQVHLITDEILQSSGRPAQSCGEATGVKELQRVNKRPRSITARALAKVEDSTPRQSPRKNWVARRSSASRDRYRHTGGATR
jgi:hypothetical protein